MEGGLFQGRLNYVKFYLHFELQRCLSLRIHISFIYIQVRALYKQLAKDAERIRLKELSTAFARRRRDPCSLGSRAFSAPRYDQ